MLSLQAGVFAFKTLSPEYGLQSWLIISLLSLFGPFIAVLSEFPMWPLKPIGGIFNISIALLLALVLLIQLKFRNRKLSLILLATVLWIALGAYYSTLGIWSSI